MIGIGTWQCSVDTMFFKGDATIKIFDNNGEYGFEISIPDVDIPEIEVKDIVEEGNTITATAQISLLPGKDISIYVEFEEDTFSGYLKIPFVGKVKLKNGKKVA